MASYKWKRENVLKLIEMVEERPCLWNVTDAEYHSQIKRRNCLAEISSELNISAEEIKKKIHTLRAQYSKERTKMKSIKSGSGRDDTYQSKWEFFNVLHFMFKHTENINTVDSMESTDIADGNIIPFSNEDSSQSTSSISEQPEPSSGLIDKLTMEPLPSHHRPATSRKRKTPPSVIEMQEEAAIKQCMAILSEVKPKDEFLIFGEYVASELRLLSDTPDIQFQLKYDIQQLIANAAFENASRRFGPSSTPSPTVQVSNTPSHDLPSVSQASTQSSCAEVSVCEDEASQQ